MLVGREVLVACLCLNRSLLLDWDKLTLCAGSGVVSRFRRTMGKLGASILRGSQWKSHHYKVRYIQHREIEDPSLVLG